MAGNCSNQFVTDSLSVIPPSDSVRVLRTATMPAATRTYGFAQTVDSTSRIAFRLHGQA